MQKSRVIIFVEFGVKLKAAKTKILGSKSRLNTYSNHNDSRPACEVASNDLIEVDHHVK